jgi:hypothetical protein
MIKAMEKRTAKLVSTKGGILTLLSSAPPAATAAAAAAAGGSTGPTRLAHSGPVDATDSADMARCRRLLQQAQLTLADTGPATALFRAMAQGEDASWSAATAAAKFKCLSFLASRDHKACYSA